MKQSLTKTKKDNPNLNISLLDLLYHNKEYVKNIEFLLKIINKEFNEMFGTNEVNKEDIKTFLSGVIFDDDVPKYFEQYNKHCETGKINPNNIRKYKCYGDLINAVDEANRKNSEV